MTLLISSITPVILFLYIIFKKDKNNEPIKLLSKCFFGGFLSVIITLIIDIPMESIGSLFHSPFSKSFFDAFFVAAIPEEFSKFIIFYWVIWKSNLFDEHYDGIVYAVFISMGFALVENVMYVFQNGLAVAVMRAILAVPGHGLFAVVMGYFLSRAKFSKDGSQKLYIVFSLLFPMLLHGTYDFLLMYTSSLSTVDAGFAGLLLVVFTVFIIFLWRLGLKKIKESIAVDGAVEVLPIL